MEVSILKGDSAQCDKCKQINQTLLCADTSGGEYGAVNICKTCVIDLFSQFENDIND